MLDNLNAEMRDCDTLDVQRIRVGGHLDQRWADYFACFRIKYYDKDKILSGSIVDKGVLTGAFAKMRYLGLSTILVERLNHEGENEAIA